MKKNYVRPEFIEEVFAVQNVLAASGDELGAGTGDWGVEDVFDV